MMGDQEEEDLRMALRMSMQNESPEPKRSKPGENAVEGGDTEESPEVKARIKQRELMLAAAERRMMASKRVGAEPVAEKNVAAPAVMEEGPGATSGEKLGDSKGKGVDLARELSPDEANQLFLMVFGSQVTGGVLAQWSNQGIRFSPDPETSIGLVQHEGGPCGVLAAIQAFVLKYLIFSSEGVGSNMRSPKSLDELFASLTEDEKSRALVRSMGEILFSCGNNKKAVVATLSVFDNNDVVYEGHVNDEVITKALDGLSIESGSDMHKVLRVDIYTSKESAFQRLEAMLSVFRSRMGAMLFLMSALLSRGLDLVQEDRDDPCQSLVTAPFGHASQEIVNLLLCGEAVAHVFDGNMDLGGGMFLKGISTNVEVGFLTLLESLNFCKVGQNLKCPKWPIWVVGSESHYTVLFALDTKVQDENEFEGRETLIRRAFDAQDQSGGGGFISVEGFQLVLSETGINLPPEKLDSLSSTGYIVWSEFWQVILDLDKNLGGLKDSSGMMGKKVFDLYHFNGIAKSDLNGGQVTLGSETPVQRPRLTKLRVSVPPRWTPEEFMTTVNLPSEVASQDSSSEVSKPELPQHAPLVDCIRTRWPRATCNWVGDPPSIV